MCALLQAWVFGLDEALLSWRKSVRPFSINSRFFLRQTSPHDNCRQQEKNCSSSLQKFSHNLNSFSLDGSWISFQMATYCQLAINSNLSNKVPGVHWKFLPARAFIFAAVKHRGAALYVPKQCESALKSWERWCHLLDLLQMFSIYNNEPTATELMHFTAQSRRNWSCIVSVSCCRALRCVDCVLVCIGYLCDMPCDILTHYRELCFLYFARCISECFVHLGCILCFCQRWRRAS